MRYKNLTKANKQFIKDLYATPNREQAQKKLANVFEVHPRTIRKWAKRMDLGLSKGNIVDPAKILIYDIETSRVTAKVWWTGKQYIGHKQLMEEPKIITIAYKWLGEDKVDYLTWDDNHCDKKMLEDFLQVYNKADMVIGQNNDRFDNRWVNARAMKYGLDVNLYVKSFDVMKQTKKLFRLPSYSMAYITKFLGVEEKLQHEGLRMWDMIQEGSPSEQKEYLQKMVDYNVQDIVATEDMYISLRKYMGHKMHFGVLSGKEKWTCPNCGGTNISLYKTTTTTAGTIQRIMKCHDDDTQFKLSNTNYYKFLINTNKEN